MFHQQIISIRAEFMFPACFYTVYGMNYKTEFDTNHNKSSILKVTYGGWFAYYCKLLASGQWITTRPRYVKQRFR